MTQRLCTNLALAFGLGLLVAGCGDDDHSGNQEEVGGAAGQGNEPAVSQPLALESTSGCAIDADCAAGRYCFQSQCSYECEEDDDCEGEETCSERGQCLASPEASEEDEPVPVVEDYEPSVTVLNSPQTVFHVPAGLTQVELTLELSDALPEAGLAYTIDRSDEESPDGKVQRALGDDNEVTIPIPVGLADPARGEESQLVNVTVATGLGAYRVALVPAKPVSGSYSGEAKVNVFGNTGLPLALQVVTQPDNVSLEDAEQAWLILPAATDSLFSPIEAYQGAPAFVSAELTYDDDIVKGWVATTEYEYRLGDDAMLTAEPGQILRTLRFEIQPMDGELLTGKFSDRWKGFYDARSADGVLDFVDVVFEGELELSRVGDTMSSADVPEPLQLELPTPSLLPAPATDLCTSAAFFPEEPVTLDEVEYGCAGIASRSDFQRATADEQGACALAAASRALSGTTTGAAIAAFLDENVEDPGGQSFAEFMEDCAEGTNGACVPTDEVLCSRQLLSHAFYNQRDDSPLTRQLIVAYQDVTREAFLGRQLAAFKIDSDTRLTWLKTTDYPAIVTNAVQDLVAQLLSDWESGVLDAHMGVLGGYFDPSGLAVMSRTATGNALDARRRLLGEMIQGWRGAMDALVVASNRYNELFQDAEQRAEKSAGIRERMLDLYLMAGILTNLTRDAGTGYQATAFGAGFSELMRSVDKLSLSFDDLVFARDAEVVVSTSLDPTSTNETILSELQADAESQIEKAAESVQTVLSQAQAEALNETQLQNRMGNEINDLRDELVGLCGLPVGCTTEDFRSEPECEVRVASGRCGFSVEREGGELRGFSQGQQSVSEAGRALLSTADAAQAVGIAAEEERAHAAKLTLEYATLEALAKNVEDGNKKRLDGVEDLQDLLDDQSVWEEQGLEDLRESLADRMDKRQEQIDRMQTNISAWNQIRTDGDASDLGQLTEASWRRELAEGLRTGAETIKDFGEATAEAFPKVAGSANDATSGARAGALFVSAIVVAGMRAGSIVADVAASNIEVDLENQRAMRESQLANLAEVADRADAITDKDMEELEGQLEIAQAENDSEIGDLQAAYDVAKAQRDAELVYADDLQELQDRRTAYKQMLEDHVGLQLRVDRSKLGVERSIADYLGIVQRAELLNARLGDLQAQRADVTQLIGSPGVVFASANRLQQAENRLQRAKEQLMDWLVALEYFAVRPFIDQRLQILLARNPYQLEEIAAEMARLQRSCGGAANDDSAVLSIREELLGVTLPVEDMVAEEELSPEQRFRELLEQGYVPIDKRVRYTTDESVGDLLKDQGRVLSATFDIRLDNFANLASTCNAKVASIDVQLVGDVGEGRPTVTLLYDGSSQLRSCQPGISEYVDLIGRERTGFGEITTLRVPGRSISPVATVNEWKDPEEQTGNVSLAGLPLASQYTVLIDTEIGENPELDWDNLEDIKLRVHYQYSDVFAEGQCE